MNKIKLSNELNKSNRLDRLKEFQKKGMISYLFNSQWTTDKNKSKYRHMYIIPFPVWAGINYSISCLK